MPTLKTVFIWPPTGFAHEQWGDSPEQDSLLRTSRRVCDSFSVELAAENIAANRSEVRMFVFDFDGNDLEVAVIEQATHGFECGHLFVPRGFHTLPADVRTSLVADGVEMIVSRLGEVRGWDVAAIHRSMDRVRSTGYTCAHTSLWKSSPDRSLRARVSGRLLDDGYARVRFEFSDGSETEEFVANSTLKSITRMGKELRWSDNTAVSTTEQMSIYTGGHGSSTVRESWFDFAPASWTTVRPPRPNNAQGAPAASIPRVSLRERPSVTVGSGMGPMNGVPRGYARELDQLIDAVCESEAWLEWWRIGSVRDVFLPVSFGDVTEKVIARRHGESLTVTLYRPTASIPRGKAGVALARADILAMVDRAQERLSLPAHPPLR